MPETASIERINYESLWCRGNFGYKRTRHGGARDLAIEMSNNGEGHILNQFSNKSNYLAHYDTTVLRFGVRLMRKLLTLYLLWEQQER